MEISKRNIQAARFKIIEKQNFNKENEKKILALKNKYNGERCFIVGGSPSLKLLDLTKLENEYTFTVNYGFKLKDMGLSHSSFHVMMDIYAFLDDKIGDILPVDFSDTFFINAGITSPFPDKTIYLKETSTELDANASFQFDLTKPILNRRTVILACLQLAMFMGFKDIYLIGVDLDYVKNPGHAYQESKGEIARFQSTIQDVEEMYYAIKDASELLEAKSIHIYNASAADGLHFMKKVDFNKLF